MDSFPTPFVMFPLRLVKLRDLVLARPFINEDKLVDLAYTQVREDEARIALFLQSLRKKEKGKGSNKRFVVEENVRETRKVEEAARQPQDKVLEMQNELRLVTEKQTPKSPGASQSGKGGTAFNRSSGPTWQMSMSRSPLAHTRVVTSRSSKLNYLLKEAGFLKILNASVVLRRLSDLGFGTFPDGEILDIFQHAPDASSCRGCPCSHRYHVPSVHNCLAGAHSPTIPYDV
jgi:hypothetical protein